MSFSSQIKDEIIKIREKNINYFLNIDKKLSTIDFIELDEKTIVDICKIIERDFTTKGYIDTLSLYKIYKNIPSYRTSQNRSIIVNLFKNDFQTQYIHRLFYGAQQFKKATRYPETLYNVGYAEQLISQRTMHY